MEVALNTSLIYWITQTMSFLSQFTKKKISNRFYWSPRPTRTRPVVITIYPHMFVRPSPLFIIQRNKTDHHCRACVNWPRWSLMTGPVLSFWLLFGFCRLPLNPWAGKGKKPNFHWRVDFISPNPVRPIGNDLGTARCRKFTLAWQSWPPRTFQTSPWIKSSYFRKTWTVSKIQVWSCSRKRMAQSQLLSG